MTEPMTSSRRRWTRERSSRGPGAIAAASDLAELDEARVRFLGRKSELKQALRDVRDRETGMALNAVRVRLESALDERQRALERAELERSLREERVDVTLPGDAARRAGTTT